MTAPSATVRPSELLTEAHLLADAAGAKILPHFRKALKVENKHKGSGFDPVTIADMAAERAMRQAIRKRFPDHGITGEEYDVHASASRYTWVLDPIDGTRAFMCGLPTWGTLIGLLDGDAPIVGMMDQPYVRERFWAAGGKAQMRAADGRVRPIKTRKCARLADAVLSATSMEIFATKSELAAFNRIGEATRMLRFGADCYAYCMLAAGHIDLVVEAGLKDVDIVALIPIIEAAGGVVTSWNGGSPAAGGQVIACGDPALHKAALAVLAGR